MLVVLCLVSGCLDTHDASLGEQAEDREAAEHAPEAGQPTEDAGRSLSDAGPNTQRDAESEDDPEHADAATSLLCRLEPWHCRDS